MIMGLGNGSLTFFLFIIFLLLPAESFMGTQYAANCKLVSTEERCVLLAIYVQYTLHALSFFYTVIRFVKI